MIIHIRKINCTTNQLLKPDIVDTKHAMRDTEESQQKQAQYDKCTTPLSVL